MKRGISFKLPNDYGTFLGDMLKPIDVTAFSWQISETESYQIVNNELCEALFQDDKKVLAGTSLKKLIEQGNYYVVFANLKAYPKGKITEINTYEEFVESNCELVVLVVDSYYATIYCKDNDKLELLFKNAQNYAFENVEYVTDENDTRTGMSLW